MAGEGQITVHCSCGKKLKAPQSAAGKKARCPACGSVVRLMPNGILASNATSQTLIEPDHDGLGALHELSEQGRAAVFADSPACPSCRSVMEVAAILCTGCGYDTRTGKSLGTIMEDQDAKAEYSKNKRDVGEMIIAQWPGALGLLLVAAGLGMIWQAYMFPPYVLYIKVVAVLFAGGIAAIGYWAFANNNSDYKF